MFSMNIMICTHQTRSPDEYYSHTLVSNLVSSLFLLFFPCSYLHTRGYTTHTHLSPCKYPCTYRLYIRASACARVWEYVYYIHYPNNPMWKRRSVQHRSPCMATGHLSSLDKYCVKSNAARCLRAMDSNELATAAMTSHGRLVEEGKSRCDHLVRKWEYYQTFPRCKMKYHTFEIKNWKAYLKSFLRCTDTKSAKICSLSTR